MALETQEPSQRIRSLEPFDPFELEDTVSGNIRTPIPRMAELRRQSPVHVGPVDLGDGSPRPTPPEPQPVTVFGFDEAVQVLRDNETFSSTVYEGIMGAVMGRTILQMDEPEHRLHRALVSPTFRSKVLEQWEGDLVQRVVNELIDGFAGRGHRRPGPGADLQLPGPGHRPDPRTAPLRLPHASSAGPSRSPAWPPIGMRGMAASEALRDYFAERAGRATAPAGRRPDQRAGGGRGGRPDPRRRGDLLVPAAAAAGRGRDHLPGVGEHALRAPDQSRSTGAGAGGPIPAARRLRGDHPLGAPGHRDPPQGHPRHRDRRGADRGGRRRGPAARLGQPRRAQVRAPRRASTSSGRPARAWGSDSACTSASACTWPAWRPGWPSTPCSTGCPTCDSRRPPGRTYTSRAWRSARPIALPITFTPS